MQSSNLGVALDEAILNADDLSFSGDVLVADAGAIVLRKSYGFVESGDDCSVEHGASRWIGSLSKQFCAVAIASLVQEGRLDFDDPMGHLLTGVPDDKAEITIHQLLTHTSGLPDKYPGDGIRDRAAALAKVLALKLEHRPGTKFLYSNAGYQLLAIIVEELSQQSFEQFMRTRFFTPLGMNASGSVGDGSDWRPLRIARSDGENPARSLDWSASDYGLKGSTGVLTSASDLYRWHRAFHGHELLTPEMTELALMRHIHQGDEPPSYYGYGWSIFDSDDGEVIAHSGSDDFISHNSAMEYFRDRDLVFVVLSDAGTYDGENTSQAMIGRLIDVALSK